MILKNYKCPDCLALLPSREEQAHDCEAECSECGLTASDVSENCPKRFNHTKAARRSPACSCGRCLARALNGEDL